MEQRVIEMKPGEELNLVIRVSGAGDAVGGDVQQEEPAVAVQENGTPSYTFGKTADAHFDIEDAHNSEYLQDLKNALRYYEKQGVTHIDSTGDLCQYKDKDLVEFRKAYDSRLPFFTAMGNHDYLRIYQKRDASHPVPSEYKSAEDMWYQTVSTLSKGADVHYFGTTFKDRLNFFFEEHGDLHVFISIDYGQSQDRYDVIRALNLLDYSDPYVKMMTDYVSDTQYDRSRERDFDYRFYNPAVLIWLKGILESNPKKRVFLNMHHFMPNGSGDTVNVYRHLRIWPVPLSETIRDKFYSGSNTLCGLTFHFIDKLLRNHTNVICSGGHTHSEATAQEDLVTRAYRVTLPKGNEVTPLVDDINSLNGTQYDYQIYRTDGHSYADTAPTVHLPSLAKPCTGDGVSLYGASEGVLVECYDDCVTIKYIQFKAEGSAEYVNRVRKTVTLNIPNDKSPLVMPTMPDVEPTEDCITMRFINRTGEDIRFAGKFLPYIQEQDEAIDMYLCAPNVVDDWCHWSENPYSLKNGETKDFKFTHLTHYRANGGKLTTTEEAVSKYYGKHFRTADTAQWPTGIAAIKFGVYAFDRSKKETSTGAAMIHAVPIAQENSLIKAGGVYDVILDKIKDNATLDKSWTGIAYKEGDRYKYVIM